MYDKESALRGAVYMKSDTVQLEFRCPECHASGLTPRMSTGKAVAVAHGTLQLRCPHCAGIIQITEPLASVMLKRPLRKAVDTISSVLQNTFKDKRQRTDEMEPQSASEITPLPLSRDNPPVPRGANPRSEVTELRP